MFVKGAVRSVFWVSLGATAGVLVFRKVTSTAKEFTPAGIADRVSISGGGLLDSVKSFWEDVQDAMHNREEELNVALGIDVTPTQDEIKGHGSSLNKLRPEADPARRAIGGRTSDDA